MHQKSEALSPWGMPPVTSVEVFPLTAPFNTTIALPGSKSYTNRALIMAAIAHGTSTLRSPLFSDDSYWCVDALKKLGITAHSDRAQDLIEIEGLGTRNFTFSSDTDHPYIGSAGTIARFLPGGIAAKARGEVTLTASSQLSKRPVLEMIQTLRQLGAEISLPETGSFPMTIKGGTLKGGTAQISGKLSSQFISGVLIAAPLAQTPVTLHIIDEIVQADYVRMTIQLMKKFGVHITHNEALTTFHITPQNYQAQDIVLEADASTATYFVALAAATKSQVTITNLDPETLQPDFAFIDYLKDMGCDVTRSENGHIAVTGPDHLQGNKVYDFNPCSDSTPALAAVAPFANGPVEVTGVAHIRKHESNRIRVIYDHLIQAGLSVTENEDGLIMRPVEALPRHITVDPHDDHRMAMAFSVMGAAGQGALVMDPACVSKTCPNFFELLQKFGVRCRINT